MFCPECSAPNEADAAYCGNCGAALHPERAAVPSAAPEAMQPESNAESVPDQSLPSTPEASILPAPPELTSGEASLPATPPPSPPRPQKILTSGLAVASLVLGVAGWAFLPVLGSAMAIILGHMARRDIRRRPDQVGGREMATAGIVLGWITLALTLLAAVVVVPIVLCSACAVFGW